MTSKKSDKNKNIITSMKEFMKKYFPADPYPKTICPHCGKDINQSLLINREQDDKRGV